MEWTGGINFVAVAINGEFDLFARAYRNSGVYLSLFYYDFQPRLIQYHQSYKIIIFNHIWLAAIFVDFSTN